MRGGGGIKSDVTRMTGKGAEQGSGGVEGAVVIQSEGAICRESARRKLPAREVPNLLNFFVGRSLSVRLSARFVAGSMMRVFFCGGAGGSRDELARRFLLDGCGVDVSSESGEKYM